MPHAFSREALTREALIRKVREVLEGHMQSRKPRQHSYDGETGDI